MAALIHDTIQTEKIRFSEKLTSLWPALPYLALGSWLAWAFLAYSGSVWLSDTEINGIYLSHLYITSTLTFAVTCVVMFFAASTSQRLLASHKGIMGAALLASIGSLLIVLAGPYYLATSSLFYIGSVLTGMGTAVIALKCGELYGELPPRKVLLYASLSQFVIVFLYFFTMGLPQWAPVTGGPAASGICALILLPLLAAWLCTLPRKPDEDCKEQVHHVRPDSLPRSFWKMTLMVTFLAGVVSIIRSIVINTNSPAATVTGSNSLTALRVVLALLVIFFTVRAQTRHIDFGRIYSLLALLMVFVIAFIPLVGSYGDLMVLILGFLQVIFEFVVWNLLAFIIYQKKVSSLVIFSLGWGGLMLGDALGWLIGITVMPTILALPNAFVFYLILAALTLIMGFMVFTERDFDKLFSSAEEGELDLQTLLEQDLVKQETTKKSGLFRESIDYLSEKHSLSKREEEALRYLAMGRSSSYIAEQMTLSWNTVRAHTHNVYVKLDVHSRQELIDLVDVTVRKLREENLS